MQTQITGKQIDIGDALRGHVSESLTDVLGKYPGRPTDAETVFSKSGHEFNCETSVNLSTGLTVQAKAHAHEIYAAFDQCCEKIDKQLRRYKRRLKDHSQQAKAKSAALFVMADPMQNISDDTDEGVDAATSEPMVIAESTSKIKTMTPGMAALELGLAGNGVVVFHNVKHGGINVVFKRSDGHIGWIDPS